MRTVNRERDERGAVAIMVALFATTLLVLCAFVTDFGMAYSHKRDLQNGADAAALAAAQVFEKQMLTECSASNMAPVEALRNAAETQADAYLAQNVGGDAHGDILPGTDGLHCQGTGVEVVYAAHGDTPTTFGRVAVSADHITTNVQAAAAYDRFTPGKLRPWGICSTVLNTTGEVTFVGMKGAELMDGTAGCDSTVPDPPGGWYIMSCTDSGGPVPDTSANVTNGCSSTVTPVPDQTSHSATPSQLWSYLTTFCPKSAKNTTCLGSDTGNPLTNFDDEWQPLVGKTIEMPVMCYPSQCSDLAVAGSGSTASYAVHKIAIVEICGFGLNGDYSTPASWPTDDCTSKNPKGYKAADIDSHKAGFFLIFKGVYGADSGDKPNPNTHLRITK